MMAANEMARLIMKRPISILLLSLLCLILNTWAAEQVVNLAGTWILDTKNSDPFPHPIRNLGAPSMGGSDRNVEAGGGAPSGGTPSSTDMQGGMPGGRMGRSFPGTGRGPQQPAQNPPMVIEQNGTELKISRIGRVMGKEVPMLENYVLDGAEHAQTTQVPGSPDSVKVVIVAKPKKNSVQVRITTYGKNKGAMKKEFLLSKDGKTLTVKSTTATPTGDMIQDQIYNKAE
jgi:hypothetical protein